MHSIHPARRISPVLLIVGAVLLAGCGAETGFTNNEDGPETDIGQGEIELYPESVTFSDLEIDLTSSEYLLVSSVGDENLEIYEIRIYDSGDGVFYMEEKEDLTLAPGAEKEFAIAATLTEEQRVEGAVRIECNDLETPTVMVDLVATPLGWESSDTGGGDTGGGDTGG